MLHQNTLGNFKFQGQWFNAGFVENFLYLLKQQRIMELFDRKIDSDPQALIALLHPADGLKTGLFQNPLSYRHNEAHILQDRDEFFRTHNAQLRMTPA